MTIKKFIDNFEEYFIVWTLALMTILIFIQVVMRYVFSNSLSWSEEMARYLFLWCSWIGASYAVKERSHFRVEMFANLIKGQGRKYYELLVLIIWFIFSVLMTWYGTQLLLFIHETGQISSGMEIPMTLPYASVPAGCGLMSLRLLIEMHKIFRPGPEAVQGS